MTLLDEALMGRFEAALRRCGVDVDALLPGLSDGEIDELIGPADLLMPEEARVWWRWRNGSPPGQYLPVLPYRQPVDLEQAVERCLELRKEEFELADGLRVIGDQPIVLVECAQAGGVPAPIWRAQSWSDMAEPVLPSMGDLVSTWIGYLESNYVQTADGRWADAQPYTEDMLRLGVG